MKQIAGSVYRFRQNSDILVWQSLGRTGCQVCRFAVCCLQKGCKPYEYLCDRSTRHKPFE